jgi:hypothetical protein
MKAVLWDTLKAELWREGQGKHVGYGAVDTPESVAARMLYDRMLTMEALAHAPVLGQGVDAVLAGRGV